jgi:hypothetical protein
MQLFVRRFSQFTVAEFARIQGKPVLQRLGILTTSATVFAILLATVGGVGGAQATELTPPASERFASEKTTEAPDFRRHVLPLFGRLGCNGRACHGSFQGQGGFRLSLFGYDFDADHQALLSGKLPRVNIAKPTESLILQKPTLTIDHEGGERMRVGSWEYRLLLRWIEEGAKPLDKASAEFDRLEVVPSEIVFARAGEKVQLKVIAHWRDGSQEDVTPLCRYRTNDESVAQINEDGLITSLAKGDTQVVALYDNGVVPVATMLPVSDLIGDKYPAVPMPTRIDELVVAKLRRLGIVPSEPATDAEFLRRVSLDITGTLPQPDEITAFLADKSPDKRDRKIDELLARPAYAAWWATRLCDLTGDNPQAIDQVDPSLASRQWYGWLLARVKENMPYDKIVEGLVLATGRTPGESYTDYCREMGNYYKPDKPADFAGRATMPLYWSRRNFRKPEEMALGFSNAFLGVQLQCAQCHKHPFDRWTKQDFEQFSNFFTRVSYGFTPYTKNERDAMLKDLGVDPKDPKKGLDPKKQLPELLKSGKLMSWQEVFVAAPKPDKPADKAKAKQPAGDSKKQAPVEKKPAMPARLLGGETIDVAHVDDPRKLLMDWLRREPKRYFARSIVNRVWAAYFGVGIIQPADDLNLANPASNGTLLDYLTAAFVDHGYDLNWLHREIAHSRTYQLSWKPNETNRLDARNFSHALVRRLPAKVAYDAIAMATAGKSELAAKLAQPDSRAIGAGGLPGGKGKQTASRYALAVFGKPPRLTNCDCERNSSPSLLQTIFLRNDQELFGMIDRDQGWLREVGVPPSGGRASTSGDAPQSDEQIGNLVHEAFLRTLSRPPSDGELTDARQTFHDSDTPTTALRNLLWALLNTKEFIVNH